MDAKDKDKDKDGVKVVEEEEYPLPKFSDPEFKYIAIILIGWVGIALLAQI